MSNPLFDYLCVGAGLFSCVFAREMTNAGKKCIIIEKRDHIGGNCYSKQMNGIEVHQYGPHIFHTSNKEVWNWINQFTEFNNFTLRAKARIGDKIFSLPINLNTLMEVYGTTSPEEALNLMTKIRRVPKENTDSLEDWAIDQVGVKLYELFIKGYTEKHWGKPASELPSSIIKRLPIRYSFDDNYFSDTYQGIPVDGYTKMFENMIGDIPVICGVDYFEEKHHKVATKVLYTGEIDKFFNYEFGKLEYRSVEYQHEVLPNIRDYQGAAMVNYPTRDVGYNRIIEHKHFHPEAKSFNDNITVISKEFSSDYDNSNKIPAYPVCTRENMLTYAQYKKKAEETNGYLFGGRLANFAYMDMHQIISSALAMARRENA